MSQVMKKGDAVIMVGYNSLIMQGLLQEDVNPLHMNDSEAAYSMNNTWYISPGDCFLVKSKKVEDMLFGTLNQTVLRAMRKRGYYWKIVLDIRNPRRTKHKP